MAPEPVTAPPAPARQMLRGWRWLLASASLNTLIALALTLASGPADGPLRGFGWNLVHSQCIGLAIWGLIDLGRLWLVPDESRQWPRLIAIVPVAVALGYAAGTLVARLLLGGLGDGWGDAGLLSLPTRPFVGTLLMSLAVGAGCTYFFMSRARLAAVRVEAARALAQAEAAQRHAVESQLRLLQAQLEPHMLFNTLANLRALVGIDAERAQTMLDHLVAFLRATLSASRATLHPLHQEFARLDDYLALMAVRMGPRLRYTLDLPDALREVPVPPLLLQPLVENSIRHGLEPLPAGGQITVQARQEDGWLRLEVRDNGAGPQRPQVAGPQTAPSTGGFGLLQVRQRLEALYGDRFAIECVALPQGGTRSGVRFPLPT